LEIQHDIEREKLWQEQQQQQQPTRNLTHDERLAFQQPSPPGVSAEARELSLWRQRLAQIRMDRRGPNQYSTSELYDDQANYRWTKEFSEDHAVKHTLDYPETDYRGFRDWSIDPDQLNISISSLKEENSRWYRR
jgi:hypothetical protein